jgi:hypothetical protein
VYLVEQSVQPIAGSRESRRALASKIAGVLESNYARFAYSAPVETFRLCSQETRLYVRKDEAWLSKIIRESGTYPERCFLPRTSSRIEPAPTSVARVHS